MNKIFIYLAAAISALSGLLFGYDVGVISGAILFIQKEFSLTSGQQELVVSSVLIGSFIGACAGGALADFLGRRRVLMMNAIIFGGAAIGTALAPSPAWLIFGRIIEGFAIGIGSFTAPLYISEIAPSNLRGRLVSLNQLAITSGILISYSVDYAFASSVEGWRWMLGAAVLPAAAFGVGLIFIPESPRWLFGKGKTEKAKSVLQKIRKTQNVETELDEIRKALGQKVGKWSELLSPGLRPAMMVGVGLAIAQQITGINTVIYYAPTIFKFAGFSSESVAILATVGVGAVNVVMTIISMQLIDRLGRRPLILGSLAGMFVSLLALGSAFLFPQLSGSLGIIAVVSLMIYVGSFAIGLGPVFWLLLSEIYPGRLRGRAMSIGTAANWASNLLVAYTFLSLTDILGRAGIFLTYAVVTLLSLVFAYFYVPETMGKSLEQIEADLQAQ